MPKRIDFTGQRFGRLEVLRRSENKGTNGAAIFVCRCDCGVVKEVKANCLRSGSSTSCGCYGRERNSAVHLKHGQTASPTYLSWISMKQRCYNPRKDNYHSYGGRGIKVCARWLNSFASFMDDMGERPAGHTLDRIDTNGNYCPENCRWANSRTQSGNRRTSRLITYKGKMQPQAQWAREIGVHPMEVSRRIKKLGDEGKAIESLLYESENAKPSITPAKRAAAAHCEVDYIALAEANS